MSLWVPAADPGAVDSAAGVADRLVGGLAPESPKLATLVTSGWSGQAATAAATESSTLGRLLTGFCDRVNAAAGAMRGFAQAYRELKARFVQLSAAHDDAERRRASLDSAISACSGRSLTPQDEAHLRHLVSQRDETVTEIARLEQQHRATMDQFQAAQQRTAGELDSVTPAGVTGSLANQQTQIRALVLRDLPTVRYEEGRRLGEQIRHDLRDHGSALDPEQIAALAAGADDPDFVRGLYETLGPAGVAALSREARNAYDSGYDGDRELAARLRTALATSFTTAADQGLIDDQWLDRFDPAGAFDPHSGAYSAAAEPTGFRADLLVPLVQDGTLPERVLEAIGNRLFTDLKSGMDGGGPQVLDKWNAYEGGDPANPYERNLAEQFLGTLSHNPEASNGVLLRNFDTLQRIGRGDLVDEVTDQIGNLTKVVDAGVLGVADLDHDGHRDTGPDAKGFMGDALMGRLVLDTADHPDDHYEDFYRAEIGALVTDDRYFNDAMYSVSAVPPVSGPTQGDQWLDWDGRPYRDGIELDRSAWAAVHQEVMADPATATTIIAKTRAAMEQASIDFNSGKVPDPNNPGGTMADPQVRSTAGIARNAMHAFLMDNLDHASSRLDGELQEIQDREHGTQEAAHGALTTIIGWATDPTTMPTDVVTRVGTAGGNAVIDGLIHQHYQGAEADVQGAIDGLHQARDTLHPDRLNDAAHVYADGAAAYAGDPGLVADITVIENGRPVVYTGDPQAYIDRYDTYDQYSHRPISADFRGPDGHPIPVDDMNSAQLQAYEAWLHDPAVQRQAYQNNAALRNLDA